MKIQMIDRVPQELLDEGYQMPPDHVGTTFEGNGPLGVIDAMRDQNMFTAEMSRHGYMDSLEKDARKMFGIELPNTTGMEELERAQALFTNLIEHGLARDATNDPTAMHDPRPSRSAR